LLSLGKIGGGDGDGRSAGYYTASVAKGRDDYYTGKGEAPGEWFGQGAAALGLEGMVEPGDFQQIVMEAIDPRSGRVLRKLVRDKPVQGMDMTFSAPKSASLLFHLGGEEVSAAVRQAHDEAVQAALGYMEREACVVRAGDGGKGGKEAGEGFVGAVFRHRTSRALDPQLHSHAVVANLAKRRKDGRYIALDGTALFQQAKTGGCLYQAELRARLTEYLGVEWNPVRNGAAEIKGIARPVIDHFSKRRAQIVEAMAERRSDSARSAQEAALETRPEKQQVDLGQLVLEWRSVAAELGLGRAELEQLTGRVVERPLLVGEELRQLAGDLGGPHGLTRQASVSTAGWPCRLSAGRTPTARRSRALSTSPTASWSLGTCSRLRASQRCVDPTRSAAAMAGWWCGSAVRSTRHRRCSSARRGLSAWPRGAEARGRARPAPTMPTRPWRRARGSRRSRR